MKKFLNKHKILNGKMLILVHLVQSFQVPVHFDLISVSTLNDKVAYQFRHGVNERIRMRSEGGEWRVHYSHSESIRNLYESFKDSLGF